MLKIFIDKKDTVPIILEKIQHATDGKVTLVVPRGAKLGEGNHLYILKKHVDEAGKELVIESIDEHLLELASRHEIQRIHPLFEGGEKRPAFSDIRSHKKRKKTEEEQEEHSLPIHHEQSVSEEEEKEDDEDLEDTEDIEEEEDDETEDEEYEEEYEEEKPPRYSRRAKYLTVGVFAFILIVGSVAWGVGQAFSHVDVEVSLKKTNWQESTSVTADKSINVAKSGGTTIPAMLFTEKKNTVQLFKASGKRQTSQKATAKVTVYNAYDSSPQILVATTRLATPDGKIFRLDNRITVPGAKIANGKITPAGIEAAVTADEAGEEYNIGPFEKMTVVGFKGTPRYNGFYAVMKEKASGGFIGEAPYPTDEDITQAKEKTQTTLQSALDINIRRRIPEEFKIVKGASSLEITKMTINEKTDEQGNFSVIGEGQLSIIAFKEDDVKSVLEGVMKQDHPDLVFHELAIDYSKIVPNFSTGRMTVQAEGTAILTNPFDVDKIKEEIAGKSIENAKNYFAGIAGLEEAKIGIWPPWLWSLPGNTSRITVTTD